MYGWRKLAQLLEVKHWHRPKTLLQLSNSLGTCTAPPRKNAAKRHNVTIVATKYIDSSIKGDVRISLHNALQRPPDLQR
jgi:dUTPase